MHLHFWELETRGSRGREEETFESFILTGKMRSVRWNKRGWQHAETFSHGLQCKEWHVCDTHECHWYWIPNWDQHLIPLQVSISSTCICVSCSTVCLHPSIVLLSLSLLLSLPFPSLSVCLAIISHSSHHSIHPLPSKCHTLYPF